MDDVYERLTAVFGQEAYNIDRSRGFQLIGIRGAFVVERLTEVFGLLGHGWRYAHSPFVSHDKEIVTEIVLQYRVKDSGIHAHSWDPMAEQFTPDLTSEKVWSETIPGTGGNQVGSGGVPVSDAYKSAVSSALSKAASRLGVGIDAYKGRLTVDGNSVVVKEDSGSDPDDAGKAMKYLLRLALLNHPDKYDLLAASNSIVAANKAAVLNQIIAAIKKAELYDFATENLPLIVGDKDATKIGNLTAAQMLLLNEVAKSISAGDVTWKGALEIAESLDEDWGTVGSWAEAVEAYKEAYDERESPNDDNSK